jgi:hypothetical protein
LGDLIQGNDGLIAEEVGLWVKEKHDLICRYVDICRSARRFPCEPHAEIRHARRNVLAL